MGTFMLLINIPLFILGSIFLGHGFGIRSIYGTILFSVFTDVTALLPGLTENLIMASVFGGALPVSYTHLDVYKRQVDYLLGRTDVPEMNRK